MHGTSAPSHQIGDEARRRQNVYRRVASSHSSAQLLGPLPRALHAATSLRAIRVALWNREVVFCSPSKGKLRLPSVEYEEIWKENELYHRIVSFLMISEKNLVKQTCRGAYCPLLQEKDFQLPSIIFKKFSFPQPSYSKRHY